MSRTQCRRTRTKHTVGRWWLSGLPGLLTMAHPIRPQLYFRRRDEMYGERTDVRNVSSAYAGRGKGGEQGALLAFLLPSGLLTRNPESQPATWIRLSSGSCSSGTYRTAPYRHVYGRCFQHRQQPSVPHPREPRFPSGLAPIGQLIQPSLVRLCPRRKRSLLANLGIYRPHRHIVASCQIKSEAPPRLR